VLQLELPIEIPPVPPVPIFIAPPRSVLPAPIPILPPVNPVPDAMLILPVVNPLPIVIPPVVTLFPIFIPDVALVAFNVVTVVVPLRLVVAPVFPITTFPFRTVPYVFFFFSFFSLFLHTFPPLYQHIHCIYYFDPFAFVFLPVVV
jgi:hypothetical protein